MNAVERLAVWLGGSIFVAALAYAAYAYTILWSTHHTSVETAMWQALLENLILFGAFASHHSLFARDRVKSAIRRAVPQRLIRSLYVWAASALFILVIALWEPVGGDLFNLTGWPRIGPALVQLAGVWLIAQSVRAIDPLELAGIRQSRADSHLQANGPYRLVRHPLYLGWMMLVFGAAHMTGDRLTFAVISSAYLLVAIPWEERSLEAAFGDEYARYRMQVRWRVIPFVY